jgi:2-alkyl-3-oxoalkanoate reductase
VRIFVAGATGVVGRRLIPLLAGRGHHVVGTTRNAAKIAGLHAAGAQPIVMDGLDRDAVMNAVVSARPDVVVHQMSALATFRNLKKFDDEFAVTNRLRTEGTEYLLEAAIAVDARRFVAQSYTGWPNIRTGSRIKTEDDPLDPHPPKAMRKTLEAIRQLESIVTPAAGPARVVLRYGSFYGPGTSFAPGGDILESVRRRKFPMVGNGAGVWSFIHIGDAAHATTQAIEQASSGIYNIVDDDPAEVSVWLPVLAQLSGAKAPYHVPAWIARFAIGGAGVSLMTAVRGSSNAKAKRLLTWQPMYPSWRDAFRQLLATERLAAL